MSKKLQLNIDYYDEKNASVTISNPNPDDSFGDLLMFCTFVTRMMVNFGKSNSALAISSVFSNIKSPNDLLIFSKHSHPDEPNLIPTKSSSGNKKFIANLDYSNNINFQLDTKGFGFFAKGIDYYGVHACFLLLKHLIRKYEDNIAFLTTIAFATKECGRTYTYGDINIRNQSSKAYLIALNSMGN